MTTTQKWAARFFEEKNLPYQMFEIEHNDNTHLIDNMAIINIITNNVNDEELERIKNILVQIDFFDGDVNTFLETLAKSYIACNY